MKHVWLWIILAALALAGCQAAEDPAGEIPAPAVEAEAEEPAADPALEEAARALYAGISGEEIFTVTVAVPDGTLTAFDIEKGRNDWNVRGREYTFSDYAWSAAPAEEWEALLSGPDRGYLLTVAARDGGNAIRCCSGGDVVELTADRETTYARAVNPREGREPYEWKLYGNLEMIAEDAMSERVWAVTADGTLTPAKAAERLAEQVAENYRAAPDWVEWKPRDARTDGTNVFDIYWGEPENFCCGMGFRVLVEDLDSEQASYWQAGAGLGEPDGDGYYGWGREVLVRKNGDGDWYCADRGTGGYSVLLPKRAEGANQLAALVEDFYLTEGFTHESLLPYKILSQPAEALAKLPALLEGRTEQELLDFGAALMGCYQSYDQAYDGDRLGAPYPEEWVTQEDLRTALGPCAGYLDA